MKQTVSIKFDETINTWAVVELQPDGALFRVTSCGDVATFKMTTAELQMLARTAAFLEQCGYLKEAGND